LRKRSPLVSPSTSRFFFLVSTIWRRQTRTCVGSNGVLQQASARCSIRSLSIPEPMGRRNDGQSTRPTTGQAWHCHRTAGVQSLPRCPGSDRWQRLANFGARPQRLLFASTGTKDPKASDVLYISALAAPNTVNTMPEKTLLAFGDHGKLAGLSRETEETARWF
jgi:hypothetical protein